MTMAKATLWFLLTLLLSSQLGEAYKILVMFPIPNRSHTILGNGIVNALLQAGHEITYINPYPWKTMPKNLRHIDVSSNVGFYSKLESLFTSTLNSMFEETNDKPTFSPRSGLLENLAKMTYEDQNVQTLLNDRSEHFDVVIIEWMFTEVSAGLSAVFNCPFVWVSTVEPHWSIMKLVDEPLNPAYNPDMRSEYITPLTFWQRVKELWHQLAMTVIKEYLVEEEKVYREVFEPIMAKRGRPLPPFHEIKYNASLVLGNSHATIGEATRLPQIYKPIGGYHVNPKVEPLPEDLQKLMDNSKHGVIYFSMGSNVKSKNLPEKVKKGLLKIFGGLQQTVVWKFEEDLPGLPSNVHIVQWAPQPGILTHPNCILFITHGGLLSTIETIHFGVPIIGIPVFADQFGNVMRAEKKGIGKKVEISRSLVEDLNVAIREMVKDPSYRERVKALSLAYHSRVAPPVAELVHWVEHVVRTRGAPHLRSPALMLPWYQKLYLDLIALIVLAICLIKTAIKRVCCSRKTSKEKKNN